jgi:hypothetical protein
MHRVREAIRIRTFQQLGGAGKFAESDEIHIRRKPGSIKRAGVDIKTQPFHWLNAAKKSLLSRREHQPRSGCSNWSCEHRSRRPINARRRAPLRRGWPRVCRYNNRIRLDVDDLEKTRRAIRGTSGKRLAFRAQLSDRNRT